MTNSRFPSVVWVSEEGRAACPLSFVGLRFKDGRFIACALVRDPETLRVTAEAFSPASLSEKTGLSLQRCKELFQTCKSDADLEVWGDDEPGKGVE